MVLVLLADCHIQAVNICAQILWQNGNSGELSRFEGLSKRVRAWIQDTVGWWTTEELDRDLGIADHKSKENRRKILLRLREDGIIESHPKVNKQFRYVNTRVTSLAFKTATNAGVLPVKWPLGIQQYVNLFPGNIAVAAGIRIKQKFKGIGKTSHLSLRNVFFGFYLLDNFNGK